MIKKTVNRAFPINRFNKEKTDEDLGLILLQGSCKKLANLMGIFKDDWKKIY